MRRAARFLSKKVSLTIRTDAHTEARATSFFLEFVVAFAWPLCLCTYALAGVGVAGQVPLLSRTGAFVLGLASWLSVVVVCTAASMYAIKVRPGPGPGDDDDNDDKAKTRSKRSMLNAYVQPVPPAVCGGLAMHDFAFDDVGERPRFPGRDSRADALIRLLIQFFGTSLSWWFFVTRFPSMERVFAQAWDVFVASGWSFYHIAALQAATGACMTAASIALSYSRDAYTVNSNSNNNSDSGRAGDNPYRIFVSAMAVTLQRLLPVVAAINFPLLGVSWSPLSFLWVQNVFEQKSAVLLVASVSSVCVQAVGGHVLSELLLVKSA